MILNNIVSFFRKNTYIFPLIVCLTIGATYFCLSQLITGDIFTPTKYNYYIYLLDAFFHGHINVTPPYHYDLSIYQNKWYMVWGPSPVLFILPFYILFHLNASDVMYTAIGGTINVALFYAVIQEFKKYFMLSISLFENIFILLNFGLASPNLFLSVASQIWFTSQIFATTYLLLFYLFYFQFLNREKYYQLILCVIFFCLACLSRSSLLFNGILFIYLFIHYKNLGRAISAKIIWFPALLTLAFASLGALYNYLKFHNILETGERFVIGASRYAPINKNAPILSIQYVLRNMYYCFLNTVHFSSVHQLIFLDPDGNSVFLVYPVLLLLPALFCIRKYIDKKRLLFLIIAGTVIVLNISLVMLYFATGWQQFGYRYFFDVIPLLFLLPIFILQYIPFSIQMVLLTWGIVVNFCGVIGFYTIR
jgi:hypothetical protein